MGPSMRDAIKTAFLDLAATTPVDAISVKMIADALGINRSTFYNHFEDKHQLLNECTCDLVNFSWQAVSRDDFVEFFRANLLHRFEESREHPNVIGAFLALPLSSPYKKAFNNIGINYTIQMVDLLVPDKSRLIMPELTLARFCYNSLEATWRNWISRGVASPEHMASHLAVTLTLVICASGQTEPPKSIFRYAEVLTNDERVIPDERAEEQPAPQR